MAVSTRHLQRKNLRDAVGRSRDDDGFGENPPVGLDGGGGASAQPSRGTARSPPRSGKCTGAVLAALSDRNSMLARFLFVEGGEDSGGSSAWFASHRNVDEDANVDEMPPLGSMYAMFYPLALEPMEVRNQQLVQIFEAYAIFGALFANAVWIVYEWGGGYRGEGTHAAAERAFGCIMAIALSSNMLVALFGAWWWILALGVYASSEDFVLEAIDGLKWVQGLMMVTFRFIVAGMLLGTYLNLSPHWPETTIALLVAIVIYAKGSVLYRQCCLACAPLEIYHAPNWIRLTFIELVRKRHREDLKTRAGQRAQALRERVYRNRRKMDPNSEAIIDTLNSVGTILHRAATNLGESDCDVSSFQARLADDWFKDAVHLQGLSVDILSRYMPYRLAIEVHRLVEMEHRDTRNLRIPSHGDTFR